MFGDGSGNFSMDPVGAVWMLANSFRRHPERSRFSGGVRGLARMATALQ
jgi:hypothetical protein